MKLLVLGALVGGLLLAGCGDSGNLSPNEEKDMKNVMSKPLGPPSKGPKGAGQAKAMQGQKPPASN